MICRRLSDRMPDVASGRSRWSSGEERHLADCEACRLDWAAVRMTVALGAAPVSRLDESAIADSLLRRLRAEFAAATPTAAPAMATATAPSDGPPGSLRGHRLGPWHGSGLLHSVRRREWLPLASAAVLLFTVGSVTWWAATRLRAARTVTQQHMVELMAQPGRRATFPLPDGSWVVLREYSRLRYAAPLATGEHRDVYLEGEAYFDVAHDDARPFRVHTGPALTRVLGTRFGVRAYSGENTVRVVVAEGRVSLGGGAAPEVVLGRGELGMLKFGDTMVVRHGADVASSLAWATEAVFADARKGELVLGVFAQDTLDQEHRMKLWKRSVAGLMLALPTPALVAQTITPADLVGTWVSAKWYGPADSQYVRELIYTFRADSTWAFRLRNNGIEDTSVKEVKGANTGRWKLQGDSILFLDSANHVLKDNAVSHYRAARKGEQLLIGFSLEPNALSDSCATTLHRVDGSQPLPPPSMTPPPITINPAALVGTWVSTRDRWHDTLTLGADSTVEEAEGQEDPRASKIHRSGTWGLYPGDILGLKYPTKQRDGKISIGRAGPHIVLQGEQLIFTGGCDNGPLVYQRVKKP